MAQKKELHIDEILNNLESGPAANKQNKDSKKVKEKDDWGVEQEDENGFTFGIGKNQPGASKTKPAKKKPVKEWGDPEGEKQAQQTKTVDFAEIQKHQEKKSKVMKKPGESKPVPTGIDVNEELFPSLGQEQPKHSKKNEPITPPQQNVTETKPTTTNIGSGGVRKFVNPNKKGQGESFRPLDENLVEKNLPEKTEKVVEKPLPEKTEKTEKSEPPRFFRKPESPNEGGAQEKKYESPKDVATDSKFKFGGGEGPKKFTGGSKISFKRDEGKSEQDRLREEREREIEEKLQKEREEAAKQREEREAKKLLREEKNHDGAKEKHEPTEERKVSKFTNTKKEGEKHIQPHASNEKPQAHPEKEKKTEVPQEVTATVQEDKPGHAKEHIEVFGALSNKGWGDGPILSKKNKNTKK
jgi:hypothetical protein